MLSRVMPGEEAGKRNTYGYHHERQFSHLFPPLWLYCSSRTVENDCTRMEALFRTTGLPGNVETKHDRAPDGCAPGPRSLLRGKRA